MRTILLLLLLSGAARAQQVYVSHPQSETEAISEVKGFQQYCANLQARKAAQDAGNLQGDPVTQADIDYTCKVRLSTAQANLKNKIWLNRR